MSDRELRRIERQTIRNVRDLSDRIREMQGLLHERLSRLTVADALRDSAEAGGTLAAEWRDDEGRTFQAVASSRDAAVRWRRWYPESRHWSDWHESGLSLQMLDAEAQLVDLEPAVQRAARRTER